MLPFLIDGEAGRFAGRTDPRRTDARASVAVELDLHEAAVFEMRQGEAPVTGQGQAPRGRGGVDQGDDVLFHFPASQQAFVVEVEHPIAQARKVELRDDAELVRPPGHTLRASLRRDDACGGNPRFITGRQMAQAGDRLSGVMAERLAGVPQDQSVPV